MNIDSLLSLEDKEIFHVASSYLIKEDVFSEVDLAAIEDFNDCKMSKLAKEVHHNLLLRLIATYVKNKFSNSAEIMNICFSSVGLETLEGIKDDEIPALCEQLHISFLNSRFSLKANSSKVRTRSKEQLIELGAVYTQSTIAKSIVDNAFLCATPNLDTCKVLDFACGTGRFYENIVTMFEDKCKAILNNIYAIDIDCDALNVTRLKALSNFSGITKSECETMCLHIALKNGLRKGDGLFSEKEYLSNEDFDGLVLSGFDIIVSNPPYLVLKPNKSKAGANNNDSIQEQVSYYRNSGVYHYSIEGMLNLYQLSIERMLQMLKPHGVLGVICPSTLFGDVSATKLRRHLLINNRVLSIEFFAEKIPLFENVSQATNIFILEKGIPSDNISIKDGDDSFVVNIELVKELFPANLEIPIIHSGEWSILRKLAPLTKLKDCKAIRNRRGELDLSLCREFITSSPTPFRLVRGNMIGENGVKDGNGEYVKEEFISTRSSDYRTYDFSKRRLICQQISNGGLRKRLRFIFCAEQDILGNSCNYISATNEDTLYKLYLLLNSSILNWRFKITSSNNHINNYELAELPIVDLEKVDSSFKFDSQSDLDEYIGSLYGLTSEEIKMVAI